MATSTAATAPKASNPNKDWPAVNKVSLEDLVEVMALGIRDFRAAPVFGMAVGALYAGAGWFLIFLLAYVGAHYLVYPLAMGFALIAPFASVIFYAVSDFLAKGKPVNWGTVWAASKRAWSGDLRWMALVTAFTFFFWIDMAAILFLSFLGFDALGPQVVELVLTTPEGWMMLVVGNIAGALLAISVFSISVVTYPMLYDRNVDFVTAMMTSVRLVLANPVTMAAWCATIAVLTGLALLAALVGLVIMLPVVGHASWHLYKRAVGPVAGTERSDEVTERGTAATA